MLYYSFIYPYFHYGIIAWGKTTENFLKLLPLLQKKVIRIISSAQRLDHTDPLVRQLGLLKLKDIYIFNVMFFMYRFKNGLLPNIFNSMFTVNKNVHYHFTRQRDNYHIPSIRIEVRKRSICFQGLLVWNKLAEQLDIHVRAPTFKFHLKRYLQENEVHF